MSLDAAVEEHYSGVISQWLRERFVGGSEEEAEVVVEFLAGELVPSLRNQQLQSPKDVGSVMGEWKEMMELGQSAEEEIAHYEELLAMLLSTGKPGEEREEEQVAREEDDTETRVDDGCCEMCERPVPLTRHHLIPRETHTRMLKRGVEREALNRTINICRACHNAVHNVASNKVLATEYNTLERLMEVEAIKRFVAWNAKQRPRTIIRRCPR